MCRLKTLGALVLVPAGILALGCESDTATEVSLVQPSPSFATQPVPPTLCLVSAGVRQSVTANKKIIVTGTGGGDAINCSGATVPVKVSAGKGNDIVVGSPFDDMLKGGKGCDRVSGGPGDDLVDGGPDNDGPSNAGGCTIPDAAPYNTVGLFLPAEGGLRGTGGDDLIKGGPGDDALTGDGGLNDVCRGGPGADTFTPTCETAVQGPA